MSGQVNRIIGIERPSAERLIAEGEKIFTPLNHFPGGVNFLETINYCSGSLPISAERYLTGAVNPVNPVKKNKIESIPLKIALLQYQRYYCPPVATVSACPECGFSMLPM